MVSPFYWMEGQTVGTVETDSKPLFAVRFADPPRARPSPRGFVRCRLPGYEPVLAHYYKRSGADGMDNRWP